MNEGRIEASVSSGNDAHALSKYREAINRERFRHAFFYVTGEFSVCLPGSQTKHELKCSFLVIFNWTKPLNTSSWERNHQRHKCAHFRGNGYLPLPLPSSFPYLCIDRWKLTALFRLY